MQKRDVIGREVQHLTWSMLQYLGEKLGLRPRNMREVEARLETDEQHQAFATRCCRVRSPKLTYDIDEFLITFAVDPATALSPLVKLVDDLMQEISGNDYECFFDADVAVIHDAHQFDVFAYVTLLKAEG